MSPAARAPSQDEPGMNSPVSSGSRSTVHELIEQRERLRGWIAKLDEVRTDAPSRVTERVRGDYEARLQGVTEELGTHREELERDLSARREDLTAAEERRVAVAEALDEVRLRHMIGELDDRAWDESRPDLEREVEEAEQAFAATREEVDDLTRLLAEIRGAEETEAAPEPEPAVPAGAPVAEAEPEPVEPEAPAVEAAEPEQPEPAALPGPFAEDLPSAAPPASQPPAAPAERDPFGDEFPGAGLADDEDLPWLETLERKTAEWEAGTSSESGLEFLERLGEPAPPSDKSIAEDDLAFLEELDRAIAGNTGANPPPPPPKPATDLPTQPAGATPAGRLICKECGAPNEPHAWYCEVCGSEL
jgi:hypothetical protein